MAEGLREKMKGERAKGNENRSDTPFIIAVCNASEPIAYSALIVTPDSGATSDSAP